LRNDVFRLGLCADVKPANVMVVRDSSGTHVKLLDFGLAHAHEAVQRGDVAGTISYMAPELFEGEQPSEAADMFAFGAIAYEVFAGQHPFDRGDDAELVLALLGKEPDWKAIEEFPRLVELLERLLSKSSLMRPSAAEALDALAQAMGIEVPKETSAMRDSALQAARFVGREGPWVMLRSGLDSARAGAGAAWLLAGESGVGKSRLMDELRVYALVQKVQVARGQAVREGGGAYCVWRQVLRMLCLASDPEELQASILKSVLPDLEALLERQIPDAPPLGPQAAELRLVGALEGVLTRQAEPLLLLLEDLHWADAESLHVLNRIAAVCSNFRIMIVASYRDDERADLPAQLPQCQLLKLSRLSSASLELLCESMLGKDACTPELVMFLERETEGNVFFVIEVLRFLAEQAGQLSLVAAQPLPKTVTTGGIQAVVQRRLAALPPAARPLLNLAAVAGRVLDLKLLKTFEPQLEQWLYIAVDAMILEATEQVWRFAHDKIRETLLVEMGPAEQQRLHLALAQAMTRVFPDSPAHAASLAEHFEKGGDAAQACHYSIDAGVYALNQSATQQAATFLQQARSSSGWSSVAPASAARALNHLMQACQVLGQLQRSVEVYEDLCALAKVSTVADRTGVAVLCRYSLNRLWSLVAQDDAVDTEQLRILHELAQATRWAVELFFWLGEIKRSVLAALLGIEIAQRVADKGLQAYFVVTLSCIVGLVPLRAPSQWLLQKGEKLAAGLSDSRARLDFFRLAGTVRWNEASLTEGKAVLDSAIADARAIGDEHSLMFALSFRGLIAFRTDDMPAFHAVTSELHERSERAGRPQWQRMYPMYKGVLALRERDYEAAQLHFQEAESAVALSRDHHGRVMISGQLARCALWLGNIPEAIARAGATVEMAANELRTFETIGRALCAVAETYLEIWKLGDKELQRQVAQPLQRALALARTCALTYPVLRAETLLRHSQYAQLHGASRLAKELALVSLYSAQRLGMAFDERSARAFIAELEKCAPADLPQLPRGLLKIFQVFARRLG